MSPANQCEDAGIPFFFKQWGEWVTESQSPEDIVLPAMSWRHFGDRDESAFHVGKKAAGRELDGRTNDDRPLAELLEQMEKEWES